MPLASRLFEKCCKLMISISDFLSISTTDDDDDDDEVFSTSDVSLDLPHLIYTSLHTCGAVIFTQGTSQINIINNRTETTR